MIFKRSFWNSLSNFFLVVIKWITLWLWGGFIYYCMELIYRKFSFPSMFVVGGICFLIINFINKYLPWRMNFFLQCVIGAVCVTIIEFISGLILNVWLKWDIWDYSDISINISGHNIPLHIMGQICVPFMIIWLFPVALGILLSDVLNWKLFNEQKPTYSIQI